jgi:hypothetical protein
MLVLCQSSNLAYNRAMKVLYMSENHSDSTVLKRILRHLFKDLEILIVSSEFDFFKALKEDTSYGFFILDAEIKNTRPEELAESIISLTENKPILFVGQSAFIQDRINQEVFQANSLNDKVFKPFNRDTISSEVRDIVVPIVQQARKDEFNSSIQDVDTNHYISMKLRYFYLTNTFPYDIYLEIAEGQYIKIISANEPYSISELHKYAKRNVKILYIKKDDHLEYLESESQKMISYLNKSSVQSKDYLILILRSITLLHQYMIVLGATETISKLLDETCNAILNFEHAHTHEIKKVLRRFPTYYEGIASKSFMTALIAVHLAKKMSWESRTTKLKMIACSILQDYSLPVESLAQISYPNDTRLAEYTEEEREQYYEHPIHAANIARQFSQFTDIDYILETHQEIPQKKGFPKQIIQSRFTSICCIFNLSQFLASSLDGAHIDQDYFHQVLRAMKRDFSGGNFKQPFDLLEKLIA